MKLHFAVIICVLAPFSLWGQTETRVSWDPDQGKITEVMSMRDGVRHGLQVWIQNGLIHRREYWDMGHRRGPIEEYWPNGNIYMRYGIDNQGRIHGTCYRYYANKKLQEVAHYHQGQLLPGSIRTYYPNGKVAAVRCYRACVPTAAALTATPSHWPTVGTAAHPQLQPDSTWLLYNYKGRLHRQREYHCAQVVSEQQFTDFTDTLVGGTNPMLADFTLKNTLIGQDSAGYPLIVKHQGRYGRRSDHEAWINRRSWVNKELAESYYISRMRNTEALKTYYPGGRTRSNLIHQFGAPTRQGSNYYTGTQLRQQWTEDLGGSKLGAFTHYWPNGKVYVEGYYAQDSTQVLRTLQPTQHNEDDTIIRLYASHKHGTWRYYSAEGVYIREERWHMGTLQNTGQ